MVIASSNDLAAVASLLVEYADIVATIFEPLQRIIQSQPPVFTGYAGAP